MFTLLATRRQPDRQELLALEVLEEDALLFRLPHVAPYQSLQPQLLRFLRQSRYLPFLHKARRTRQCCVDLTEWSSEEAHLETFLQFLHDYDGFFRFNWVFLAPERETDRLYDLLSTYFPGGLLRQNAAPETEALAQWFRQQHPGLALGVARAIAVQAAGENLTVNQTATLVEDLCQRALPIARSLRLTENTLRRHPRILRESALYRRSPAAWETWLESLKEQPERV